jgi:hypothetical protein
MEIVLTFSHIGYLSFLPFILSVFIHSFVCLVFALYLSFPLSFFILGGFTDKIQATWNSKTGALQVQQSILSRVSVTKQSDLLTTYRW